MRTDLYHADELFFTGHGRRDHADPLGRRPRDRAGADHEGHPGRVLRDHGRALGAVGRVPRLPQPRGRRALVSVAARARSIPLSAPDLSGRGGGARARGAALGHPRPRAHARAASSGLRRLLRHAARRRGLERDRRAAPGRAPARHRPGRRGHHHADQLRGLGQRGPLRAGDAGLRRRRRPTPSTSTRPPSRPPSRRARARSCPSTSSATRATSRPLNDDRRAATGSP